MLSFLAPIVHVFQVILASVGVVVFSGLAVITLGGSVVALVLATPLFLIFSPILVPAATAVLVTGGMAGIGIIAFAVTAMGLMIWLIKFRMGMKAKNNPPPKGAPPTEAGKEAGTSEDPDVANKEAEAKSGGSTPAQEKKL